jgi:hypothetical protein
LMLECSILESSNMLHCETSIAMDQIMVFRHTVAESTDHALHQARPRRRAPATRDA